MWTAADRERYGRGGLRYPSDLTDAEWALVAPLIRPAKRGGRRRSVDVRAVMDGLLYVLETGCQWRLEQVCAQPLVPALRDPGVPVDLAGLMAPLYQAEIGPDRA
jgi:Putative transposase of IS4/5 family (DUF4096)